MQHHGESLESRIWDATHSIPGAKGAPKYKGCILPSIVTERPRHIDNRLHHVSKDAGAVDGAHFGTKTRADHNDDR